MSVDFIVISKQQNELADIDDAIAEMDFSNLIGDSVGIYEFVHALNKQFEEYSFENLSFARTHVHVSCDSGIIDETMAFAKDLSSSLGLVFYDPQNEDTILPNSPPKTVSDEKYLLVVEQFFSDYEELFAFYRRFRTLPRNLDERVKVLAAESDQGNQPVSYYLANIYQSRAQSSRLSGEANWLDLLEQALGYARRCSSKAYAKGQIESIQGDKA